MNIRAQEMGGEALFPEPGCELGHARSGMLGRALQHIDAMSAVTATEFAKAFGRYKEEAQREPVAITSYGRVSGYFVSAHEYEELQRLRAFERRVLPWARFLDACRNLVYGTGSHDRRVR